MRLLDSLRDAEKKGMSSVRKQVERAREEWDDVERRIRQRMRIYPKKLRAKMSFGLQGTTEPEKRSVAAGVAAGGAQTVKPIISIHGRDLRDDESEEPAE